MPMKRDIKQWPPLISLIKGLLHLGHEVYHYSYFCTPETLSDIDCDKLEVVTASSTPYPGSRPFLVRAKETLKARSGLKKFLNRNRRYDFVWLGEWDYPDIVKIVRRSGVDCPIVYQLHEYNPRRFPCCQQVDRVVVPEENRAWMTYFNAGIENVPLVLPNIPLNHPREIGDGGDRILSALKESGKRIVLYQGHMDLRKRCLIEMVQAIAMTDDQFVLAILPANLNAEVKSKMEAESKRLGVGDRVIHLETRTPPAHLGVVGQADIGIGLYRPTTLNQVYCAPNRLYEFTGFGIPVILPDFPGIRKLEASYAGIVTCDPNRPEAIAAAICKLQSPESYRQACDGAAAFFAEQGDYLGNLQRVLEQIQSVDAESLLT